MNEYFVYRYTDKKTGEVVYVGKTDHSLSSRIRAHKKEEPFKNHDCYIDFVRLSNSVETDSIEKLLINYYKPEINIKDKTNGLTEGAFLPLLNWEPFDRYKETKEIDLDTLIFKAKSDTELIFKAMDCIKDGCWVKNTDLPHFSGLLRYRGNHLVVLSRDTIRDNEGYKETFKKNACDFIDKHFYEMIYESWKDVLQKTNLSLNDRVLVCKSIHDIEEAKKNKNDCENNCKNLVLFMKSKDIIGYEP